MNGIMLLLGTNLGDRLTNLKTALHGLSTRNINILKCSSVYETEPYGISDQPWFYNVVIEVFTHLKPHELLSVCLQVEKDMGRERKIKWGERLIDIDILCYGPEVINDDNLTLPHPGIADRNFTLIPLRDSWGDWKHPVVDQTAEEMLRTLDSNLICRPINLKLINGMD